MQVGKAASKGGSVADKAGSAAKDIKGKNPFGEWVLPWKLAAVWLSICLCMLALSVQQVRLA